MTAIRDTPRPPAQDNASSGMWARDLLREAVAGLFARPVRMALTVLGTVIGLAALVATLGLSRTASHQDHRQVRRAGGYRDHRLRQACRRGRAGERPPVGRAGPDHPAQRRRGRRNPE